MRDSPKSPVRWLDRILSETRPVNGHLNDGGGGQRSELLCGGFTIEKLTGRPLLAPGVYRKAKTMVDLMPARSTE